MKQDRNRFLVGVMNPFLSRAKGKSESFILRFQCLFYSFSFCVEGVLSRWINFGSNRRQRIGPRQFDAVTISLYREHMRRG